MLVAMPNATRHEQIEEEFRGILAAAGLPQPEDVAHMRRALVFLWYETKAFVLVDLSELPDDGADALASLDLEALRGDVTDAPMPGGFADTA
jgi:hypothetical protein